MSENEQPAQPDFSKTETRIQRAAYARLLKLLKDPDAEVPPGQLMAFLAKVGWKSEPESQGQAQIKQQNIFAILPGLPPERQQQILDAFQKQLDNARKELPSGG